MEDYRTEEEIREWTKRGEQAGADKAEQEAAEAGLIEGRCEDDWLTWEELTESLWLEDLETGQNRVQLTCFSPITWTVRL